MTQTFIVLGLGFGDEGKGRVVDYLASQYNDVLVIRFNGGHQAGHTVWYNGKSHIFSSFGSGTFQEAPTFISNNCTIYPPHFINELEAIEKRGFSPKIYIDPDAMITTAWDFKANQIQETNPKSSHGSTGVGFGKTIERNEKHLSLTWRDVKYRDVFAEKARNILIYYGQNSRYVAPDIVRMWEEATKMAKYVIEAQFSDISRDYKTHIYEGAQGIMLDQDFGFFPNVTRSNTTCLNALLMLRSLREVRMCYVTRTYSTRHGTGYMPSETLPTPLDPMHVGLETNNNSGYQGLFRKGTLSVELLKYAIECNRSIVPIAEDKEDLFITCCDQMEITLLEEPESVLPGGLALANKIGIEGGVFESHHNSGPFRTLRDYTW